MKKLIVFVSALTLSAGLVNAQDKTAKTEPAKQETKHSDMSKKCDMKNCCMMKDGKMVSIVDGKEMPMDKEMAMKNGMKCMPDGTCVDKNGKKSKMKNGECCDMDGNMCMMPMHKNTAPKKAEDMPAAK